MIFIPSTLWIYSDRHCIARPWITWSFCTYLNPLRFIYRHSCHNLLCAFQPPIPTMPTIVSWWVMHVNCRCIVCAMHIDFHFSVHIQMSSRLLCYQVAMLTSWTLVVHTSLRYLTAVWSFLQQMGPSPPTFTAACQASVVYSVHRCVSMSVDPRQAWSSSKPAG